MPEREEVQAPGALRNGESRPEASKHYPSSVSSSDDPCPPVRVSFFFLVHYRLILPSLRPVKGNAAYPYTPATIERHPSHHGQGDSTQSLLTLATSTIRSATAAHLNL